MPKARGKARDPKFWRGLMWPGIWYERKELGDMSGLKRDTCGRALDEMVLKGHLSTKTSHNKLLYKRRKSFDFSKRHN